jgi:Do/DeqQ family serine protease
MIRLTLLLGALALSGFAAVAQEVPKSQIEIRLSFSPVVKAAAPGVANIFAKRVVQAQSSPLAADPFFSQFFGGFGQTMPRVQSALGSGVILSSDGYLVTNYHVVGLATDIRAVLSDGREYDAEILIADEASDVAILKLIDAADLPNLSFRNSDTIEVGDLVLAIGNPFGVGQTVTSGIISSVARTGLATGNARGYYLQTDAAINPGNSGGALVDMAGQLVGINTSILTRSGGSNGIGFAIPSNLVATFLDQARSGGVAFQRPWAGMSGQAVDFGLAEGFGLERTQGMVISQLHIKSPFALAGLLAGDVIIKIEDLPINGPAEMLFHMSVLGLDRTVGVEFIRDGTIVVAAVEMMRAPEYPPRDHLEIDFEVPLHGLIVENINPAVVTEQGLPFDAEGVVVTDVQSFAARVGLRPGDVILAINGSLIATTADVSAAAQENTRRWRVDVQRGGQAVSLNFRI